jgi:hypothetical protein
MATAKTKIAVCATVCQGAPSTWMQNATVTRGKVVVPTRSRLPRKWPASAV